MITERRGMPDNSISNPARAKFAGVGIVFQGVRGEALVVQSLTPGGPAELSGRVEVGDVLFTINEAKVADMDDSEFPFLDEIGSFENYVSNSPHVHVL
jgi:C-terminal processing protease CtpA/Prc